MIPWGNGFLITELSGFIFIKSKPNQKVEIDSLKLNLRPGTYTVDWISPLTGENIQKTKVAHKSDVLELTVPAYDKDIALKIKKL
jgi:hypothetical protein